MNLSKKKISIVDIYYFKTNFEKTILNQKHIYGYINKISKKHFIIKIKTLQTILTLKINKKNPAIKKLTFLIK